MNFMSTQAPSRSLITRSLTSLCLLVLPAIASGNETLPQVGTTIREPAIQKGLLQAVRSFWGEQLKDGLTTSYTIERRCDCNGPLEVLVDLEDGTIVRVSDFPSGQLRYEQGDTESVLWGKNLPDAVSLERLLGDMQTTLETDPSKPLALRGEISWPLRLEIRTAGLLPHEEFGYLIRVFTPHPTP